MEYIKQINSIISPGKKILSQKYFPFRDKFICACVVFTLIMLLYGYPEKKGNATGPEQEGQEL